jgi:hypothetical protein
MYIACIRRMAGQYYTAAADREGEFPFGFSLDGSAWAAYTLVGLYVAQQQLVHVAPAM